MAEDTPVSPAPAAGSRRDSNRVFLWILGLLMAFLVAPTVGCMAFGFAVTASSGAGGAGGLSPAVAVIRISGPIMSGSSGSFGGGVAGAETIIELIQDADEDSSVRAIVLRIDSPGGGVVASDEIYHALQQVEKPVVVSMGSMAASGGYYVAASADYIYATPHTLTGSIGVISEFVTAEELLDEVGVEIVVITAGSMKDFGSPTRTMSEQERAYWQALLDETHEAFIAVVAEGRAMDPADVRELADGRVYTGRQALELGLVDAIGYFEDAVRKAADLGGITGEPRVVEFAPEPGLLDLLSGAQTGPGMTIPIEALRELGYPSLEFRYLGPQE